MDESGLSRLRTALYNRYEESATEHKTTIRGAECSSSDNKRFSGGENGRRLGQVGGSTISINQLAFASPPVSGMNAPTTVMQAIVPEDRDGVGHPRWQRRSTVSLGEVRTIESFRSQATTPTDPAQDRSFVHHES